MKTEKRLLEIFAFGLSFKICSSVNIAGSAQKKGTRVTKTLLEDIRRVLEADPEQHGLLPIDDKRRIGSTELVRRLQSLPNSKWKKLGPVRLAKHMKQFDISPSSHRDGRRVFKGYRVGDLLKAGL